MAVKKYKSIKYKGNNENRIISFIRKNSEFHILKKYEKRGNVANDSIFLKIAPQNNLRKSKFLKLSKEEYLIINDNNISCSSHDKILAII